MCRSSLKRTVLTVFAPVIKNQLFFLRDRTRCVNAPKTYGMVRGIVKEPGVVLVGSHGKSVDLPRKGLGTYQESIEAEPHIRPFAYIYEATRTILQFLSAGPHMHGPSRSVTTYL